MKAILNYKKWSSVYEALLWDVVEREPIAGTQHKVKVKYVDPNTIKVKAVNDFDMVKADGTINQNLPEAVVTFLKTHDGTDFTRQYPALQDMTSFYKTNFFSYLVKKESDARQVVIFSILKRADFKQVGPGVKAVAVSQLGAQAQTPEPQKVLSVAQEEIKKPAVETTPQSGVKLEQSIPLANLPMIKADSPLFGLIRDLVAGSLVGGIFTDKKAVEVLNAAADELEAKRIGEKATLFIKGLLAGLGLSTYKDTYGREKERTQITQAVADKLKSLIGAPASENSSRRFYLGLDSRSLYEQEEGPSSVKIVLPENFNFEAFLKALGGAEAAVQAISTGDIKVPEGGFKYGTRKDTGLAKVQQLIIDRFKGVLAEDSTYQRLVKATATGNYLEITQKIVAGLKAGFGMSDKDPNTITAELVNKIQTENLSESYLNSRGELFEAFDRAAYSTAVNQKYSAPSSSNSSPTGSAAPSTPASSPTGSSSSQIDKWAERLARALGWAAMGEDEEEVYKVFEEIKTQQQLNNLISYWKSLRFGRKKGATLVAGSSNEWNWSEIKKANKDKIRVSEEGYTLAYWIKNLMSITERDLIKDKLKKNGITWSEV